MSAPIRQGDNYLGTLARAHVAAQQSRGVEVARTSRRSPASSMRRPTTSATRGPERPAPTGSTRSTRAAVNIMTAARRAADQVSIQGSRKPTASSRGPVRLRRTVSLEGDARKRMRARPAPLVPSRVMRVPGDAQTPTPPPGSRRADSNDLTIDPGDPDFRRLVRRRFGVAFANTILAALPPRLPRGVGNSARPPVVSSSPSRRPARLSRRWIPGGPKKGDAEKLSARCVHLADHPRAGRVRPLRAEVTPLARSMVKVSVARSSTPRLAPS